MKKIFCYLLVLCMMVTTLSVNTFAAYLDDENHLTDDTAANADTAGVEAGQDAAKGDVIGSADVPVYIQTELDTEVTNVYAISYDVSELVFVFNVSEESIWNPETLQYETTTTSSWDASSQDITVTNYSDLPVLVTPSNSTPVDSGITVTLGSALALASAFDGDYDVAGTAKSGTISVSLSGTPVNSYDSNTLLTTVTMTVTDNRT